MEHLFFSVHDTIDGDQLWDPPIGPAPAQSNTAAYQQLNLVGFQPGMGHFTDPNLNGWGLAFAPGGHTLAVVALVLTLAGCAQQAPKTTTPGIAHMSAV